MKTKCNCAFCESELVQDCLEPSFCQPCEVVFVKCPKCGKSHSNKLEKCPECEKEAG
jgi:hypothetical protein